VSPVYDNRAGIWILIFNQYFGRNGEILSNSFFNDYLLRYSVDKHREESREQPKIENKNEKFS
jgi:hypothetical protein